jgi:hypothetical protein
MADGVSYVMERRPMMVEVIPAEVEPRAYEDDLASHWNFGGDADQAENVGSGQA